MKRFFTALIGRLSGRTSQPHAALVAGVPPMLDCESVMRQLWDYLDGELTADRRSAIRSHLELCKRCHPQHQFEQSFLDAVAASAPAHSNPGRLREKLMAALEDEGMAGA